MTNRVSIADDSGNFALVTYLATDHAMGHDTRREMYAMHPAMTVPRVGLSALLENVLKETVEQEQSE